MSTRTCVTCGKAHTRRGFYCPGCTKANMAAAQIAEGQTCAECNDPPKTNSPLLGKQRFGKCYCKACYQRKTRAQPVITAETNQANRRALAYWLARNYRTRERQAA